MFRKIIPFSLGLLICLSGLGYARANAPVSGSNNFPLKVGEILQYKVTVRSAIYGANQTIRVASKGSYNGRTVYNIHSDMEAVGLVKGLTNYSQVEDLVLDAEGFYPWVIKISTKDNNHDEYEEVRFDYAAKKAVRRLTKNGSEKEPRELDLPGYVQDGLSLMFFLRNDKIGESIDKVYFYNHGSVAENAFNAKEVSQDIQLECGTYHKYLQINDSDSSLMVLIADAPERFPIVVRSIARFGAIEMKLSKVLSD
jgi:Protein of unknown function (DUF3108).